MEGVKLFKMLVAIMALMVSLSNSEPLKASNDGDFDCTDRPDGEYANPKDCATFYYCDAQQHYLRWCPEPTLFDKYLLVCVHPHDARCATEDDDHSTADPITDNPDTEEPKTDEPETEKPKTDAPPTDFDCTGRPDGEYANPKDCATFYYCDAQRPYLRWCPEPTLFDKYLLVCVHPHDARCATEEDEHSTAHSITDNPDTEEPETDEPETEKPGTEEPETEKPGTEEPETEKPGTEEPETEKPGTEEPETENPATESSTSEAELTTPSGFTCAGKPCGHYVYPEDCTRFYNCTDGSLGVGECPSGLLFNPNTRMCDFSENVPSCSNVETTTEAEFTCIGKPCGHYVFPGDCSLFYNCTNESLDIGECASGLVFNPDLLLCDLPENVPSCNLETTTEEDVVTTEEAGVTSPKELTTEDRETDEMSTATEQSETTTEEAGVTSPEEVTTEEHTTIEDATTTTTERPEEFTCHGKPSGLYPNPRNCSTFYSCVIGHPHPYLFNCSANLYFNPDLLVCDWQNNVPSCVGGTAGPPTTTTTTLAPTTHPSTPRPTPPPEFQCHGKPDGLYPNPYDCKTFYSCSNGDRYRFTCPAGLFYNPDPAKLYCDWPENVEGCPR